MTISAHVKVDPLICIGWGEPIPCYAYNDWGWVDTTTARIREVCWATPFITAIVSRPRNGSFLEWWRIPLVRAAASSTGLRSFITSLIRKIPVLTIVLTCLRRSGTCLLDINSIERPIFAATRKRSTICQFGLDILSPSDTIRIGWTTISTVWRFEFRTAFY